MFREGLQQTRKTQWLQTNCKTITLTQRIFLSNFTFVMIRYAHLLLFRETKLGYLGENIQILIFEVKKWRITSETGRILHKLEWAEAHLFIFANCLKTALIYCWQPNGYINNASIYPPQDHRFSSTDPKLISVLLFLRTGNRVTRILVSAIICKLSN